MLRSIGGIVDGDYPIKNGEAQRIPAHDDRRGDRTIFYVAHVDGVPNGYAENNRNKETVRWKATRRCNERSKCLLGGGKFLV